MRRKVQNHMRITFLVKVDIETNCCFPISEFVVSHSCIVMLIMDEVFEGAYFMLQTFWLICCLYVRLGRIHIGVMVVWHSIFFYVIILMEVKPPHSTWWKYVWGMEVELYSFVAWALDSGEWSPSYPSPFIPEERTPGTHWIWRWLGPRPVLDGVNKNHDSLVIQPVT
jgi:hypothetical protein